MLSNKVKVYIIQHSKLIVKYSHVTKINKIHIKSKYK